MAPLLPPKEKGKRTDIQPLNHSSEVPIAHKVRREWELMASVDGLFEDALAAGPDLLDGRKSPD